MIDLKIGELFPKIYLKNYTRIKSSRCYNHVSILKTKATDGWQTQFVPLKEKKTTGE
jgi:hypothetical protein